MKKGSDHDDLSGLASEGHHEVLEVPSLRPLGVISSHPAGDD